MWTGRRSGERSGGVGQPPLPPTTQPGPRGARGHLAGPLIGDCSVWDKLQGEARHPPTPPPITVLAPQGVCEREISLPPFCRGGN